VTTLTVTVLITTYNYGRLIEDAIESVLAQDFPREDQQLLVVDDGSTDDTVERLKKYEGRVEYLYKPNGGQASALNFGIQHSRGEIILFLDADDVFLPGKIARVAEAFRQNPELGMVYHAMPEWQYQTGERHLPSWPLISGDARVEPLKFFGFCGHATSAVSLRRAYLAPLLPIPEQIRMLADCFLFHLIPLLKPVLALPDVLALYRIHGDNAFFKDQERNTVEVRRRDLQRWKLVYAAMRNWLDQHPDVNQTLIAKRFRDQWYFSEKRDAFAIEPPGRLEFFWNEVRQNHSLAPLQTWKFTAFNDLAAIAALVFGYEKRDRMQQWRNKLLQSVLGLGSSTSPNQQRP
jgi:glycosyltransferase involved in cell wall biosynthesis